MSREKSISRGDIFYTDLSPTVGSEQNGIRPVLVIQNNVGNRYSPTLIAAAITSRTDKPPLPTHVPIGDGFCGLSQSSIVLLEQLRTIDRSRLLDYIGSLDEDMMQKIDKALEISVGLDPAFL